MTIKPLTVKPIKIGVLVDIYPGDQGLKVYLDTLNFAFAEAQAAGLIDRPVELVVRIADGLPPGTHHDVITKARELVEEGVLGICGPTICENAVILREYIENEAKVPAISISGTDRWYGEWCFSLNYCSVAEDPYYMTNYLVSRNVKTVAAVHERNATGLENILHFRNACRRDKIKILSEIGISPISSDLKQAAADLKAANPEAVAYFGMGLPAVHLNKAFEALDWRPVKVMNSGFVTAPILPEGLPSLKGWVGCDQYDEENVVGQDFLKRFEKSFNYRPENSLATVFYDVGNIVSHALSMASSLSPAALKLGLEAIKMLPTAAGGPDAVVSYGPYMRRGWLTPNFIVMREVDPAFTGESGYLGPAGTVLRHRYVVR
jgi:branched-chain amino acid transport system substrate-binding protein